MKKKKWGGGIGGEMEGGGCLVWPIRLGNIPLPCRIDLFARVVERWWSRHVANSKRQARHCRSRGMRRIPLESIGEPRIN